MSELSEARIKHLEIIQAVIQRMAGESARMKLISLTVVGIVASTSEATESSALALVGALLTIIFWALDARYLHLERQFRGHYDEIRKESNATDFRMEISETVKSRTPLFDAITSWSTSLVYGALLVVSFSLMLSLQSAVAAS